MKLDPRIDELCDESDASGKNYFVYLKRGYVYSGQHCFGASSKSEIRATMRGVKICNCEICQLECKEI